MQSLFLTVALGAVACTQHNPAVCCNTPTQCTDLGLDQMYGCDSGKVCDPKGACVRPACATSAECVSEAPYCGNDQLCTTTCAEDVECPGGGQDASFIHCVMGACTECAGPMDCPVAAPICAQGRCQTCHANEECLSEVCGTDGACIGSELIAYASSAGAETGNCDQAAPCSLSRAVGLGRPFTIVSPGTYTQTETLTMAGTNSMFGIGTSRPVITRTTPGPIVTIGANAVVHLEHLQISGAINTSDTVIDGDGIVCPNTFTTRSLDVVDVIITANGGAGISGLSCSLTASRSAFTNNGASGVYIVNYPLTADRCDFSFNVGSGLEFDGSIARVSNSFMTRNGLHGIASVGFGTGGFFRFCTIAANLKKGAQIGHSDPVEVSNNLIGGNVLTDLSCNENCVTSGNITLGPDPSSAHFSNTINNFHITAGSVAIDAAVGGTEDHDFDGDMRPMGGGRDVGADEAQ